MSKEELKNRLQNKVRTIFDYKTSKQYFSIIDIIGILANTDNPSNYWKVQKNRLKTKHPELVTECNQLKMPSRDGKMYFTDVANAKTMLNIMNIINPLQIEILEEYLDQFIEKNNPIKILEESEFELSVDGYQDQNNIFIQTMLAGVNSEDLFISVNTSEIIISGKKTNFILSDKITEMNVQELSYGTFYRKINLPEEINIDEVEANISHGMLTLKLTKIDKNKKRILKIKY